jgi:hypothetical protein
VACLIPSCACAGRVGLCSGAPQSASLDRTLGASSGSGDNTSADKGQWAAPGRPAPVTAEQRTIELQVSRTSARVAHRSYLRASLLLWSSHPALHHNPLHTHTHTHTYTHTHTSTPHVSALHRLPASRSSSCVHQAVITTLESELALLRSAHRQFTTNQERADSEVQVSRRRERQLEAQAAERDAEVGRALATIDRLDGDVQAAKAEVQREREARGLVEEELRLLRQSLAMQEVDRLKRVVRRDPLCVCVCVCVFSL